MIDAAMVGDDFIDVEYMNFEPVDVRSKNTISQLESLPLDAMNIILSYLTFQEFQRLSILCKRLNQAVSCSSHLHMTGQGYLSSLPPSFARGHPNTEFRQPIMTQSRALHMVEYLPPEEDLRRLLQRFQSLNALHLQGLGAIGDNVVPILNESPASNTLKHISLHGCSLSYWCNQSFRLEHLQHLTIYGGSIRANICSLLQHSNDLRSLSIGQCAAIRDDSVSDLASLLQRKLERLTLHQCVRIRQPNLQFPKLEHLNLVGCFGLSSFPDFECPNLKEMDLSFCVQLSGEQIQTVVERLPFLEVLSMVRCAGIHSLRLSCHKLRILNLNFCNSLRELRLACPKLEVLEVSEAIIFEGLSYFDKEPCLKDLLVQSTTTSTFLCYRTSHAVIFRV